MSQAPLHSSDLASLPLVHKGKVRDSYQIDDAHLLLVATDRLSAFDVVLPDAIPEKGRVLTSVSNFWFARTAALCPNHSTALRPRDVLRDPQDLAAAQGRSMVVRRLRPLPIEAVVRGYLIGTGWKDYQTNGKVCGIALPAGLPLAGQLPEPLFTPATKAAVGDHDENIDFDQCVELIGAPLAEQVRDTALALYAHASDYARERGIIIADTKFEFGLDDTDRLVLIDEALTPDSSRFWPASSYAPGSSPPSFDKQFVRDFLETLDWDKRPPAPHLPSDVIAQTTAKYLEAERRLIGQP